MKKGFLTITIIIFLLLNAVFFFLRQQAAGFDVTALAVANGLMCGLSIASYFLISSKLKSSNPQAFVRGVYSASYLKLFVCAVGVLTYVLVKRPHVHKASIFLILGIYAVYTIVETLYVSKLARKTK